MRFYTPVYGLLLMSISLILLMFNEIYSWRLKISVNMLVDFYMMIGILVFLFYNRTLIVNLRRQ